MIIEYDTENTCATHITAEIEAGIIKNVIFTGGCSGNLAAIPKLVRGMKAADVIRLLEGNSCGDNVTSCADQLAKCLKKALSGRN